MLALLRVLVASVAIAPLALGVRVLRYNRSSCGSNGGSCLTLKVNFHLTPNLNVSRSGKNLNSWIRESDIPRIVSNMNAIYAAIDVKWTLGRVATHSCVGLGTCSGQPVKTSSGTFTPQCAKKVIADTDYRASQANKILVRNAVYSQLNPSAINTREFNVWLIPYVGQTSQGRANREPGWGNALTCGVWTDKNGGLRKRTLLGGEKVVSGSLAKTVAHELGHQLGLEHNSPSTRLMQSSGKPQDVKFTSSDRSTARSVAKAGRPKLKSNRDSIPTKSGLNSKCGGGSSPPPRRRSSGGSRRRRRV